MVTLMLNNLGNELAHQKWCILLHHKQFFFKFLSLVFFLIECKACLMVLLTKGRLALAPSQMASMKNIYTYIQYTYTNEHKYNMHVDKT